MKKLFYLSVPILLAALVGCSGPGDSIVGPGTTVDSHQSLAPCDPPPPGPQLRSSNDDPHRERYMDPWAGAERYGHSEMIEEPGGNGNGYCGP
ncbi:MAG: hypothetical protein AB1483_06510 [Candidatus Zixiibacteriota bacterium]